MTSTTTFRPGDLVTIIPGGDRPGVSSGHPYASLEPEDMVFVYTGTTARSSSDRQLLIVGTRGPEGRLLAGWELDDNGQVEPSISETFGRLGGWFTGPNDLAPATEEHIASADPALIAAAITLARRSATESTLTVEEEELHALAEYKRLVAAAVTKEAGRRGWCTEVDDWLEKLGLERVKVTRKVEVTLPRFVVEVEVWEGTSDSDIRGEVRNRIFGNDHHASRVLVQVGEIEGVFDDPGCTLDADLDRLRVIGLDDAAADD